MNKIKQFIDNLTPYTTITVKNQSDEWFDGELAEQISNRDKLFKKLKEKQTSHRRIDTQRSQKHSSTSN